MPSDPEESSERLAGFIVDSLHDANVVATEDVPRATTLPRKKLISTRQAVAFGAPGARWASVLTWRAANDDAISLAAEGLEIELRRIGRIDLNGRVTLEIQARTSGFSGRFAAEVPAEELIRFASDSREAHDATAGDAIATLRSVGGAAVVQLQTRLGSTSGRSLIQTQDGNDGATLSGVFTLDSAHLATFARELRALVHESWRKA